MAEQTAEPDGATADSGLLLRHRCPRSEHARSRRALAWVSPPRPYIFLRPLSPTSLRHRRRNRTALYRLGQCSSSRAANEKGGGELLWLAVKTSARQRQCCRLWSVPAPQRLIFPRFDAVAVLRHTILCRPRRVSAGECGTRASRAHAWKIEKKKKTHSDKWSANTPVNSLSCDVVIQLFSTKALRKRYSSGARGGKMNPRIQSPENIHSQEYKSVN